jgi:hypothetical protein
MRIRALGLSLFVALCGCLHDDSPWHRIGPGYKSDNWFGPTYAFDFPEGWLQLNAGEGFTATHDGWSLQKITVRQLDPDKPLRHTKRNLRAGMSPRELSEVLVDDIRASGANAVAVVDSKPVTVAGERGFRTVVSYKDGEGLPRRLVLAGAFVKDRVWQLGYDAPERVYFQRDLPTFERALASFVIR